MPKKLLTVIVVMILVSLCVKGQQNRIIIYDGSDDRINNPQPAYVFKDMADTTRIEQILNNAAKYKFVPTAGATPTYWAKGKPYWFRLFFKNNTDLPANILFHLRLAVGEEVSFYVVKNNVIIDRQNISWQTPQQNRVYKHRNYIFPYASQPDENVTCYFRIHKRFGSVSFPLTIWQRDYFDYFYPTFDYHGWGFITGVFLFVSFFSLLLYFALKDHIYLYYAFYVFFSIGFIYASQGYMIRYYANGQLGVGGDKVRYVGGFLLLIFNSLFVYEYLQWNKLKNKIFANGTFFFIGMMVLLIMLMYIDYLFFNEALFNDDPVTISNFYATIFWAAPLFEIVGICYCIYHQYFRREAIYYLMASLPLFFIALYNGLSSYEIINGNATLEIDVFALAFIIEIIVLSILLANRFKRIRESEQLLLSERNRQQQIRTEAVLEAEERERARIARDLHDGIGQMIAAARMSLGKFTSLNNIKEPEVTQTLDLLEDSIKEIREVSHNMMPGSLMKFGLPTALKQFTNKINNSGALQINLQIIGIKERLDERIETMLYRILQEIVSNILRHAEATKVNIELVSHENELVLVVEDNGKGFDPNNIQSQGIGLKNILTRVEYLNGSVNFDSSIGKGTSVIVEIPINENP
jgi:signal transduction histidine kinase